jgi:branched-chain amino acid transport system ATP-binding protein
LRTSRFDGGSRAEPSALNGDDGSPWWPARAPRAQPAPSPQSAKSVTKNTTTTTTTSAALALLSVEALSLSFGGLAALSEVSFEVGEGEIFSLIGPNGAGKTTVFNVLTGLYRADVGRAMLAGRELTRLAPHRIARAGVARTFQNTEVFRALSALDNVLVGEHARLRAGVLGAACRLPSVWREEAAARGRARGWLERVGLGDVVDVEAGSLPLGQQKRLEMARALAGRPRLLLLDEPAGGLNSTETRTLMALIRGLRDELGVTIMLVEHDMDLVMSISDRVAVLHHGRKIADGTPGAVAADPAVIEAYLGTPAEGAG